MYVMLYHLDRHRMPHVGVCESSVCGTPGRWGHALTPQPEQIWTLAAGPTTAAHSRPPGRTGRVSSFEVCDADTTTTDRPTRNDTTHNGSARSRAIKTRCHAAGAAYAVCPQLAAASAGPRHGNGLGILPPPPPRRAVYDSPRCYHYRCRYGT
jgi:hypothetical protein